MHVLDNPAWHALSGPQITVAEHAGGAARYEPDVSVIAALADDATTDAWETLRELVGPGGGAVIARRELSIPEGWEVLQRIPCRQMVLAGPLAAGDDGEHEADEHAADEREANEREEGEPMVRLGPADVPAMLALVDRTRPGPFGTRTIELGAYLGVRRGDGLVAMAGERMRPPGYTEISAVCTDAEHRGAGLASRLVRSIVLGIQGRAETPILHLAVDNEPAHRIYRALGFETRAQFDVVAIRVPG